MKVGMMVGLGLGIASVSGCTHAVSDANVPLVPGAAAPTPLVPEAYTLLAAAVPPAARDPVVVAQDVPAPASAAAGRAAPAPAVPIVGPGAAPSPADKSNQYHPYWMVSVH